MFSYTKKNKNLLSREFWPLLIGLIVFISIGAMTARLVVMNREHNASVARSLQVLADADSLLLAVTHANSAQRAMIVNNNPAFRLNFKQRMAGIAAYFRDLEISVGEQNSEQKRLLAKLSTDLSIRVSELERVDGMIRSGRQKEAADILMTSLTQTERLRYHVRAMRTLEQERLYVSRKRAEDSGRNLMIATIFGLLLASVLVVASIIGLNRRARQLGSAAAEIEELNRDLETKVKERTADLAEANDEIQRFAYIVSHDLRSPLVNVMGFTSELQESQKDLHAFLDTLDPARIPPNVKLAVDTDIPESIRFIRSSTNRMDRLIKAILQLSRQGQRVMAPEQLELGPIIAQLADSLHAQAEATHTQFEIEALPTLVSDRTAIEQIFGNLLDNALKYLRPGVDGHIRVWSENTPSHILIHVEDNGRGIAEHDRQRVFELFRRAGTQDKPGEGIGLANVKALVRKLGGTIYLNSEEGKGSRFTVKLPPELPETSLIKRKGLV